MKVNKNYLKKILYKLYMYMAHGIFPTVNKYYLHTEVFPFLSKQEIRDIYFPIKSRKTTSFDKNQISDDDREAFKNFSLKPGK